MRKDSQPCAVPQTMFFIVQYGCLAEVLIARLEHSKVKASLLKRAVADSATNGICDMHLLQVS